MIKATVAICTYNRAKFLVNALNSLKHQSVANSQYEIIVINNNSNDETEQVCKDFEFNNPELNFRYYLETNQGLSFARNRAINEARGMYLAFIDDDATVESDYVENIIEAFKTNKSYDALGGKVIPVYETGNEPDWLSKYVWGMVAKVDNGDQIKPFSPKYPAGCNMVFRKSVFETIGNFNTDLANRSDDRYIFHQMKKFGKNTLYYPAVKVNHYIPKERITDEGIKKLAEISGSEHRKLLQREERFKTILKALDYFFKIGVAMILSIGFIINGKPQKTKLVKIMYHSLMGFLKK